MDKQTVGGIPSLERFQKGQSNRFDKVISEDNQFKDIPLSLIDRNLDQPRKHFDEAKLAELSDSIKQKGLLQPIIVKPLPETSRFLLIAGERRFRAAQMAELKTIPALIKENEDPLELGIIENLQREDLNPIEEAEAMQRLKEEKQYTEKDIAKVLGISRSNVNVSLSLTKLPAQIKEDCQNSGNVPKSLLYQIVTKKNDEDMLLAWKRYKRGEMSIIQAKKEKTKSNNQRLKPYEHKRKFETYTLRIKFKKSTVLPQELLEVLQREMDFIRLKMAEEADDLT